MSVSAVTVTVPATTANLGSGFDCIGAALALYNQFEFARSEGQAPQISIAQTDPGVIPSGRVDLLKTDASNLVYHAFLRCYEHIDQLPPAVRIRMRLSVPFSRGLGSSATAIVGGLLGANVLAGSPLSRADIMKLAIDLEGHPDNVVPALLGGCQIAAASASGWTICDIPWHPQVVPIVAIPDFELSTAEARRVLPASYSRADAIFNVAHLGLLLRGLETGRGDWLCDALVDRIHQPYRQALIQGYSDVQAAALAAGAYGLVISGAGPTLLALASSIEADAVSAAMAAAWTKQGVGVQTKILKVDVQGATASEII